MNDLIIKLNDWSSAWWQWVAHAGWQSGLVALIILGLVTAGRRWRAPLRYALLLVALVKFAIPPMLTMPTGVFTIAGPEITIAERAPTPLERIPPPPGSYLARALNDPLEMELEREFIQQQLAQLPVAPAPLHWQSWLLVLHLAGSLIMLGWIAKQWLLLRELRYNSVPLREGRLVELLRSVSADPQIAPPEMRRFDGARRCRVEKQRQVRGGLHRSTTIPITRAFGIEDQSGSVLPRDW